jgi:hypothetical protein
VKGIDGTDLNAVGVLALDAVVGDDTGHAAECLSGGSTSEPN